MLYVIFASSRADLIRRYLKGILWLSFIPEWSKLVLLFTRTVNVNSWYTLENIYGAPLCDNLLPSLLSTDHVPSCMCRCVSGLERVTDNWSPGSSTECVSAWEEGLGMLTTHELFHLFYEALVKKLLGWPG